MPPTGGARKPTRLLATNASNPDDIQTFDSLASAAKALGASGHSQVRSAISAQKPLNGYTLTIIADAPTDPPPTPESSTLVDHVFTFYEEVDEIFKGHKIRYTREQPVRVSVFDIIRTVTGTTNPHMTLARIQVQHAEVLSDFEHHQFAGSGERPTPVCTVNEVIELINLLPGVRAARFRQAGAKVLVRYLGGDETLIDEVRENAMRQESAALQGGGHMSMFQLPDGLTGMNAACSIMLSPSMHDKTVADIRGPCTYLILFDHNGSGALKFGWTKNLTNRVKEHFRTFPNMRIWCALDCHFSECAEQTEHLFKGKMSAYLQTIQLQSRTGTSKNHTEVLLNMTPERAESAMRNALDTVCHELSMHNPMVQTDMELQRQKMHMEMRRAEMQHELEIKKLELAIVQAQRGMPA
jgi:hypothetical protein